MRGHMTLMPNILWQLLVLALSIRCFGAVMPMSSPAMLTWHESVELPLWHGLA